MRICFPVQKDDGVESTVFGHFGSAPAFVVVDTATDAVSAITNRDQHHAHGACNPLKALDGRHIDVVVVGGIGAGALSRLNQAGIRVFRAKAGTVRDNLGFYLQQALDEVAPQGCCGGQSHGGACSH